MLPARHYDDDDDEYTVFVYTQLKIKTVIFQTILFSISKSKVGDHSR